jgi:hypothetical protein
LANFEFSSNTGLGSRFGLAKLTINKGKLVIVKKIAPDWFFHHALKTCRFFVKFQFLKNRTTKEMKTGFITNT